MHTDKISKYTPKDLDNVIKKISRKTDDDLGAYLKRKSLKNLKLIQERTSDLYYNSGKSSGLTDYQYDMLVDEIVAKDSDYKVPIGANVKRSEIRVIPPYHMGSMNKVKPEDKDFLTRWLKKYPAPSYVIGEKLDGLSCMIVIKNGKYTLYKRPGDDGYAADITHVLKSIKNIPKGVIELAVRGELIIKPDVFKEKYSKLYSNPRNMVAGITRGDSTEKKLKERRRMLKDVEFVAYEIVSPNAPELVDQLDELEGLGFDTVRYIDVEFIDVENLQKYFKNAKKNSEYEIDGIIVQPNIPYKRNTSGNPDYAFAFKMRTQDNLITVEVAEVTWTPSKWGKLKPKVWFEKTPLGGVMIEKATGNNARYIKNNNIGKGAVIEVTRSGDVIPLIVRVVKEADESGLPTDIPYKWDDGDVDIIGEDVGVIMDIKLFASFFQKLGIKHVGESTVKKLYESGFDSLEKIVSASPKDMELVQGFGEAGIKRIFENIKNGLRDVKLSTVLGSCGIFGDGIGREIVSTMFEEIPDILDIYDTMEYGDLLKLLTTVSGISEIRAVKIADNLSKARLFTVMMNKYATFKDEKEDDTTERTLSDIKVVLSGFRDEELKNNIQRMGGKVSTTVSKNTDILIVKDKTNVTSKVKKAIDNGVTIYDKNEFKDKYC